MRCGNMNKLRKWDEQIAENVEKKGKKLKKTQNNYGVKKAWNRMFRNGNRNSKN